nr:immunoglobulin light chain junction region [Macaca mulatta]MOV61326.1 immunoglobulin light chain junction region [Macaca mulatta]MOV63421.1 immunoglobulin light chain junction region [Macaca mulatta]MOV64259.1 immunoglobulin light chain junction region [Macaca mulatta]
CLQSGNWPHSF